MKSITQDLDILLKNHTEIISNGEEQIIKLMKIVE
jgi:hypothetical protein